MTLNPTLISVNNVTGKNEDEPRLTTKRYATVCVKDFKLVFTKVPFQNKQGVNEIYHLALEVNDIHVVGGEGEGTYADSKDLEEDDDVRLWVIGLRNQDGSG